MTKRHTINYKGGEIIRGDIVKRFTDGSFVFKGYSDRFAYSHSRKETKWFDTLEGAIRWATNGGAR